MELTSMEHEIVRNILKSEQYSNTKYSKQMPYLVVKLREYTGVGAYVHFALQEEGYQFVEKTLRDFTLSIDKIITLPQLKDGLEFILEASDGKIDYLEIFTFGDEHWDGKEEGFLIIDIGDVVGTSDAT